MARDILLPEFTNFSCCSDLVQGRQLLGLWHGGDFHATGTTMTSTEWASGVLLQVRHDVTAALSTVIC